MPDPQNIETRFAWVRFYESIAEKLLDFRNRRKELVEGVHEIAKRLPFLSTAVDKFKDGTEGPLKDICPFTTMGIFNQGHIDENRKIIAQELASFLDVSEPAPDSFGGIPTLFPLKTWFFGFEKDRQPDDIDTLWKIFDQAIKFAESNEMDNRSGFIEAYDKAIQCREVAWNLTMGLYWVHPLNFPSLDSISQDYIKREFPSIKLPSKRPDANKYLEILDTLKKRFEDDECRVHSFPDLSLDAWLSKSDAPTDPENLKTELKTEENNVATQNAKNLILYGPPGTGKTWQLNELKKEYSGTQNRKTWLIQELSEVRWFDSVFAALYDLGKKAKVGTILEHEYIRIKAESTGRDKHIRQTIWSVLDSHTIENSETVKFKDRGQVPAVFDKNKNSVWSLVDNWEKECQEQVELARKWKNGQEWKNGPGRFEFVTFHQAYGYEDFVEGIRPVQDEETGSVRYEVVPGVFKRICRKAEADHEQRYAIFIDEINRGNIASIFGELITLIETDKRTIYGDDKRGMKLTLPFSGESFGVPANLDVYGTMNTADRSIALLDTALRRRFEFRELVPNTSLIKGSSDDGRIEDGKGDFIDLRALLEAINRRIRFLLSRDMIIGHSYLINVRDFSELKSVLLLRIIPLLQEYFYDDWHRIQLVFRDVGQGGGKLEPQIIQHHLNFEVHH